MRCNELSLDATLAVGPCDQASLWMKSDDEHHILQCSRCGSELSQDRIAQLIEIARTTADLGGAS